MRKFSLVLLIAVLPFAFSCERTETTVTDTNTATVLDTTEVPLDTTMGDATGTAAPATSATSAAGQESVHVTLTDYNIEMPATLPPGPVTFHVMNNGQKEHNFEIEGQGLEKKLDSNLQPGQSGMLTADLQAGTYKVYCPVGNHEQRGMTRQLRVQ